jgi:hypothetical protein
MTALYMLGVFLLGSGSSAIVARWFFLLGWEKGRDDLVLDPGDAVGRLPSAEGESTGRHALREDWSVFESPDERVESVWAVLWPPSDEDERSVATERFEAVGSGGAS